jgi:chromosome segregation ATPase
VIIETYEIIQERDQYKAERDTLIDDIGNLRKLNEALKIDRDDLWRNSRDFECERYWLKHENKALRLQSNTYFDEWQNALSENENLQSVIEQFKHDLQYTEWEVVPALKKQNKQQVELLKDFSKFINYKLEVIPANATYKHYRRELDKLGVK